MKNLNIPLVILFFLFTTTNLSLFGQSWFWAQSYGLNDHTYLHSLNADQDGSIIISGVTANNIILGQDTLEIVGDDELGFVAKVNAMGSILWAKRIYTLNTTPFVPGYTLYSHPAPDHSMVLLSHFSDSIKVGFDTLTATNGSMYLAKLDESGNHSNVRNYSKVSLGLLEGMDTSKVRNYSKVYARWAERKETTGPVTPAIPLALTSLPIHICRISLKLIYPTTTTSAGSFFPASNPKPCRPTQTCLKSPS